MGLSTKQFVHRFFFCQSLILLMVCRKKRVRFVNDLNSLVFFQKKKIKGNAFYGCERISGNGHIINPIQSARIRTVKSFAFKYGRLEFRAKLPRGDWLWPVRNFCVCGDSVFPSPSKKKKKRIERREYLKITQLNI